MRRDEGWQFMRLGRFLERAERSARLLLARDPRLDAGAAGRREDGAWAAIIGDATSHEAYLQVDAAGLSPESVSRFLMLDPRFPRSVAFCLGEVEGAIEDLVAMDAMAPSPAPMVLARTARDMVQAAARRPWGGPEAGDLLERLLARCRSIDAALADSCFIASYERAPTGQRAQASRQAQN